MPPSQQPDSNGKRRKYANGTNTASAVSFEAGGATALPALASASRGGVEKDTGYKWDKEEDAPGYSWTNSKAREETARSWAQVVDKDRRVGNKYGDVLLT